MEGAGGAGGVVGVGSTGGAGGAGTGAGGGVVGPTTGGAGGTGVDAVGAGAATEGGARGAAEPGERLRDTQVGTGGNGGRLPPPLAGAVTGTVVPGAGGTAPGAARAGVLLRERGVRGAAGSGSRSIRPSMSAAMCCAVVEGSVMLLPPIA